MTFDLLFPHLITADYRTHPVLPSFPSHPCHPPDAFLSYFTESRSLEVRCGLKQKGETTKTYAHMLNGTLCATERALCCVVENYQTPDGLVIPEVLRPYMQGREFLPWLKSVNPRFPAPAVRLCIRFEVADPPLSLISFQASAQELHNRPRSEGRCRRRREEVDRLASAPARFVSVLSWVDESFFLAPFSKMSGNRRERDRSSAKAKIQGSRDPSS